MSRIWLVITVFLLLALVVTGCGSKKEPTPTPEVSPPPSPATTPPGTPGEGELTGIPTEPTTPSQALTSPPPAPPASAVTTGLTADGHHFWGAPDAAVTMIDFSDFM